MSCKSQLAQQAQFSVTTAWRAIKKHLLPYKIRQIQAIEEHDYEGRMRFRDWFL